MNIGYIYRKIARKYGVSVEEVKKDMQDAIDYAYEKDKKSDKERILQENISFKGKTPTTAEFINQVTEQIKKASTGII
ncbi:MAG: sporulation initiation factor Spo0A [Gottschalkiaceae bacterium]|nr:MAG: sporulation initiation factor Spo0A [Gottschalkiaceae bacterium]